MTKKIKHRTPEEKSEILAYATVNSVKKAAEAYNVSPILIYKWRANGVKRKKRQAKDSSNLTSEQVLELVGNQKTITPNTSFIAKNEFFESIISRITDTVAKAILDEIKSSER